MATWSFPNYLYRYRSFNTPFWKDATAISIGESGVWCSSLASQNDIFEGSPAHLRSKPVEIRRWLEEFYSHPENAQKVATGSSFSESLIGKAQRRYYKRLTTPSLEAALMYQRVMNMMIREWRKNNAISCFSEIADSLLMWGHYSDGFAGFCLEWKLVCPPLFSNLEPLVPVSYSESRGLISDVDGLDLINWVGLDRKEVELDEVDVSSGMFNALRSLAFQKSQDWSYEKEWRLLSLSKAAVGYKQVKGYEVSRVILGPNTSQDHRREMSDLVHGDVEVCNSEISKTNYSVRVISSS